MGAILSGLLLTTSSFSARRKELQYRGKECDKTRVVRAAWSRLLQGMCSIGTISIAPWVGRARAAGAQGRERGKTRARRARSRSDTIMSPTVKPLGTASSSRGVSAAPAGSTTGATASTGLRVRIPSQLLTPRTRMRRTRTLTRSVRQTLLPCSEVQLQMPHSLV